MQLTYDDYLIKPKKSLNSRKEVDLGIYFKDVYFPTPIMAANMDTVCDYQMIRVLDKNKATGILHRYASENEIKTFLNSNRINRKIFSIGVNDFQLVEKIISYIENKNFKKMICIDIANGYSNKIKKIINFVRDHFDIVIAGNVATKEGAKFLIDQNVDMIKCGIGNGAVCTTRLKTGHGVPQAHALNDVVNTVLYYQEKIKVIADGGINYPGDILKALAIGADFVMIGKQFSKCIESAGCILKNGKYVNEYRGMASYKAQLDNNKWNNYNASEGESFTIKCNHTVSSLMSDFIGSLKSGFSYSNARNIDEFKNNSELNRVSNACVLENSVRK